jgi:hypothetical protein
MDFTDSGRFVSVSTNDPCQEHIMILLNFRGNNEKHYQWTVKGDSLTLKAI